MKLKNKAQIESWLEKGELDEVINELKKQLKASKTGRALYADALVLSAQLKKINTDKIQRVLSYEQESLTLNNYRRSLVDFIEMIEQHQGGEEETVPVSIPKKEEKKEERKPGFAWWLLLLPLLVGGIWFVFFKKPALRPIVRICTLTQMANGHCCDQDLTRITLYETKNVIYISAVFEGLADKDPIIEGILYWDSGESYPTKPIKLTLDGSIGDICYSSMVLPVNGLRWQVGKFYLKIFVNGQPVAEKPFELIGDNYQ